MFNPLGARIFAMCDGRTSLETIVRTLQEEYPESAARIPADVMGFVNYLLELDVVAIEPFLSSKLNEERANLPG
jgi:hypothetical protein